MERERARSDVEEVPMEEVHHERSAGCEVRSCPVLGNSSPFEMTLALPRDASDHLPVEADLTLG
jgi:hypothetical protein